MTRLDTLSWEELVAAINAAEVDLASKRAALEEQSGQTDAELAPYAKVLANRKRAYQEAETAYKAVAAKAAAQLGPYKQAVAMTNEQLAAYRTALKGLATEGQQPRRIGGTRVTPPREYGGVKMTKVRQVVIHDEAAAADALAGVEWVEVTGRGEQRTPLVAVEVVYRFNRPLLRRYLLADEAAHSIPGVLELTADDDPASWRMGVPTYAPEEQEPSEEE